MFQEFVDEIVKREFRVHGIEVVQNNEVVFHHMFHDDIRYPIYSAVKTITSSAAGILVHDGKLDIFKPLAEYLDEKYLMQMNDFDRRSFSDISVERFLTMSVNGFPFRPDGADWLEFSLSCNRQFSMPAKFSYSNISAYLVGIACENIVNIPLMDYINERIFMPMEIEKPPFQTDPQGRFYGATGMYLKLHELSLLGQLYLNYGKYNGIQILSEKWVKESTRTHIKNSDGGYGYFIWTSGDHCTISGKWGQKCLIYPSKNLTVTYMSDMMDNSGEMMCIVEQLVKDMF